MPLILRLRKYLILDSEWYTDRIGGAMGLEEKDAAIKAAAHADTPTIMHTDTLARAFYTIQEDGINDPIQSYEVLDIQGNRLAVVDGRGKVPLQYFYNMLQAPCYQESMDSGTQRTLLDVAGQPLYAWDADDRKTEMIYDELRRPLQKKVTESSTTKTLDVNVYGEGQTDDKVKNLRGQVYQHKDGGGLQQINSYDFKGNALQKQQQLLNDATLTDVDWGASPVLATETFTSSVTYDALNRPVSQTDPGSNVQAFTYDKGGLLKTVELNSNGYVNDIHHDAKGQRQAIWYGNGTKTSYTYDPQTFRLRRLLNVNLNTNDIFQDLNYWYDPIGNITEIQDDAQQTLFYNNSVVLPTQKFVYDALYRLTEAKGRELIGLANFGAEDNWNDAAWQTSHKGDGNAVQNYTQKYTYDEVGNILELQHIAGSASFTRTYDLAINSNRLRTTRVGTAVYDYTYDLRGNMTAMPHLSEMLWNTQNELKQITRGADATYYQYSGGQRVRKYTDKGTVKEERIYLGSFELYRKFDSSGNIDIERSTVHVSDDIGRIAMLETLNPDYNSDGSEPVLTRYIYSNHLQSASLELDEDAEIISYEEYHPYGTTSYQAINASINAVAKRYRYTGKERDEESGLYYHGARYYAPWLARWTAVDALESKYAGMSPYNYGFNNPVIFNDPSGADPGCGSITGQVNVNLSITLGQKGTKSSHYRIGVGASLMANGSVGDTAGQFSLNLAANYSNGGLNSPKGERRGLFKGVGEAIFSPAFSVGGNSNGEKGQSIGINYLHGNATTALKNDIKYSFNYALNFHFDTDNRNQRTATYGIRIGQFSLNVLEDHSSFIGADKLDRYLTGSGNLNWDFMNGSRLTIANDVYTGESDNMNKMDNNYGDTEVGGTVTTPGSNKGNEFYWANQYQFDKKMGLPSGYNQSLNNAQTYFQYSSPSGQSLRLTNTGPFHFYSQNIIHDLLKPNFHHFKPSTLKNSWQFTGILNALPLFRRRN